MVDKIILKRTCLYSDLGVKYQQAHSGPFEDLSYRADDAVVIAALKNNAITGYGRPVVASGNPKILKQEIQRLYDISSSIWACDFLVDGELSEVSKFLLRKGARAEPYYTQIIDLTQSIESLHQEVRKSYTSLINARLSNTQIFDSKSPDLEVVFSAFKELYYLKVEKPRPPETWDVQLEMIRANEAFISADIEEKILFSAGLFLHNEYYCYYGVGKSLGHNKAHSVIWRAILHAKNLGLKKFEIGQIIFYGASKEVGISLFKSGFGGQIKTYLHLKT